MTKTKKAGRPIGARNKHPSSLRFEIKLPDNKGENKMDKMTINEIKTKIYQARDSADKVTKCRNVLFYINETLDTVAGFDSVIQKFKETDEKLTAELAQREALLNRYLKVCIDGQRTWTIEANRLRNDAATGQERVIQKREKLIESDVTPEEAVIYVPDFDGTETIKKAEGIEAKRDAWLRFQSTGLQADLPADAEEVLPFFGQYGEKWHMGR
jgi:hypothetical protein